MKIKWDIKYTTMAVYSFIVLAISIIFYLIASEVNLFRIQVGKYLSVLQPIIIGFTMAYLFNFILEFYENYLLKHVNVIRNNKKAKRISGMILTYSTVFLLLFLFLNFVLPQLVSSIRGLTIDIRYYFDDASRILTEFTDQFDINEEYYNMILEKWGEFVDYTVKFSTNLIPIFGNFIKGFLSSIWNIVLGVIISIYLLIDKERFMAINKKMIRSIFDEKRAYRVMELGRRADNIFGKFLSGKILDSLIVGLLTFIVLSIFKMPYSTLVSFIIGVTNIIPFFGPFIGAIPSFFLILFVSPIKALWFLLIILIIQQIDGNIIGPKILGDSLGISAFWILFSLLISGKLLGFIGLVIGVPLFVFIYSIIKDIVENRLRKKGLPVDTSEYYKE